MKRLVSLLCSFTVMPAMKKKKENEHSNDVMCSQAHNTSREIKVLPM